MSAYDERMDGIMADVERHDSIIDAGALCNYIRCLRRDLAAAEASRLDAERLLAGVTAVADEMRDLLVEVADWFVLTPVMQQRIKVALDRVVTYPTLDRAEIDT